MRVYHAVLEKFDLFFSPLEMVSDLLGARINEHAGIISSPLEIAHFILFCFYRISQASVSHVLHAFHH